MKFRFFGADKWDIQRVTPPWGDRPSLYEHISSNIRPGEAGLGEKGELLPDDLIVRGDKQIRWAPGAYDGVMGHHVGDLQAEQAATRVLAALRSLTRSANTQLATSLYSTLLEKPTLSYVDQLLEAVSSESDLDAGRVHAIAHWLATNAADREPIKFAIAILGLCRDTNDRDLLLTLGRHEEFTLFVSVALVNLGEEPELSLWALACLVTGWGRIQIIERLAETNDEQIKYWLLREGYENDVMQEYTALTCATTGDLLTALRRPNPDDKLLRGAGQILATLIRGRGGPVQGIESYPDGAEATSLYLAHLQKRELGLLEFMDVDTIDKFLKEVESAELKDPGLGWLQRSDKLQELTNDVLSRPHWLERVREEIKSEDQKTFWTAAEAARALDVDVWDVYFDRLQRGEDQWYFVMQTDDTARVDLIIEFAERTLPLDEIASGPSDLLGLGPEFKDYTALDAVLQELRRFPGKGWMLIRTGLQSPTIRNRNMAVMALAAWDRTTWPTDAEALLKRAIEVEPADQTRELMIKTLEGEMDESSH